MRILGGVTALFYLRVLISCTNNFLVPFNFSIGNRDSRSPSCIRNFLLRLLC
jgi:hypothetical protein